MTKTLAKLFGVIFIIVGILGFISNPIVGGMGFFQANGAHNVVHILLGLVLLLASGTEAKAAVWLKIIGIVYLVVAILGFAMMPAMSMSTDLLGFIKINNADNWLHVVLGLVVFFSGFAGGKTMTASGTGSQM